MSEPYLDDLDSGVDCGMPAAIVVALWMLGVGCIMATLITIAVVVTMAGVAR